MTTHHGAGDPQTITLITGDRVTLRDGSPLVTPGPDRTHVAFSVTRDHGRVVVLPSDVAALVSAGQLDRALFDVTQLLADGYGDDRRDDLPLIITGASDAPGFARSLASGVTVGHTLPTLHMVTVRQPKGHGGAALAGMRGLVAGAHPPAIWLDRVRKPLLDHSVPQIGGPAAHARGFTGAGVTVAVLDTGIDSKHPDLAGKVILAEDFTGDGQGVLDVLGHGTHVASIIAGTGAASGGQFAGVAPDAQLISGRVCGGFDCPDSAMLAGMEWAAAEQHAKIINLSIGGLDGPGLDPLEQAVNDLSAQLGTLFVIAAGNDGTDQTIESPGSAAAALTVGAVDRDDQLADFSSRGPTIDGAIKPDVSAPGVEIVAARASGVDPIGTPVGTAYQALSGTSMATPHAAGAAALLLQQHPTWTGAQLKAQLMASANPNAALGPFAQGAGRIDIDRGTRQDVAAEPVALDFGTAVFPHSDDPPLVRSIRYHNGGSAPITLALAATLTGPAGPGDITVDPAAITVPAGATSDAVTVTARTDGDIADGRYTGALVATAGDIRVETPLALDREPESYNLTLTAVIDGAPGTAFVSITSASGELSLFPTVDGSFTIRLPRGQYAIDATLVSDNVAFLAAPRFVLDHDVTLALDSALTQPVTPDVGNPDMRPVSALCLYSDHVTGHQAASIVGGLPFSVGPLGAELPADELISWLFVQRGDADFGPAKILYNLGHTEHGHLPRGWQEAIAPRRLATVEAHHAGRADATYLKGIEAFFRDGSLGLQSVFGFLAHTYEGPFDRTELFFGDDMVFQSFLQDERIDPADPSAAIIAATLTSTRSFHAGEHVRESWNEPPGGPGFAVTPLQLDTLEARSTALRFGDQLALLPNIVGDRTTHRSQSVVDHQHITLWRDGTKIFERIDPAFAQPIPVPAAAATYRFESDTQRPPALFPLSTQVTVAWTFRSAHVEGDRSLPLTTMQFLPALDDNGETAARVLVLPIQFGRPPFAGRPQIVKAKLEVSFDDGAHWAQVPVAAVGDRGLAVILHPRGVQHVSLRGSASDRDGNAVEQTILRAYGVK